MRDYLLSTAGRVGYLDRSATEWLLEVAASHKHEATAWAELRRFVHEHEVATAMVARLDTARSFGDTERLLISALAQADRSETEVKRVLEDIAQSDRWPESHRALARQSLAQRP